MKTIAISSKEEGQKWARGFAQGLKRPCLILLDGDLGAGKTQFVRWFVAALGGAEASSPTFAIHQVYASPSGPIDHVDLYRMEKAADFESAGLWDLLNESDRMIFVEWASLVPSSLWPKDRSVIRIQIKKTEGDTRMLEVS